MLSQLAEMTLDLAGAVRDHVKVHMARSAEGHAPDLPADPSAAYVRLGQCLRRTLALDAHFREGPKAGRGSLFHKPASLGLRLDPPAARPAAESCDTPDDHEPAATVQSELRDDLAEPRESLRADLGALHDRPERFFLAPLGSPVATVAGICRAVGLEPGRLAYQDQAWIVRADPAQPGSRDEALRTWRPPLPVAGQPLPAWMTLPPRKKPPRRATAGRRRGSSP